MTSIHLFIRMFLRSCQGKMDSSSFPMRMKNGWMTNAKIDNSNMKPIVTPVGKSTKIERINGNRLIIGSILICIRECFV